MRPLGSILLVASIALASCTVSTTTTTAPPDEEMVAVAAELCPLMWKWQLTVGDTMNDMSYAAYREEDPQERRRLYEEALDGVRELTATLRQEVTALSPGPYVDLLASDVIDGLAVADEVLDEMETLVARSYDDEATPPTYREIVSSLFVQVEKVIDVAKPELATYHDAGMIRAFTSVPQCRHGVKDASDGGMGYVPLEYEASG